MNTKMNTSILSPSGRLFVTGFVVMTILAARLQAQYVSTIVSNGLNTPYGVTVAPNNNVYIADTANNRIALYVPGTKILSTLAGLPGTTNFGTNNGIGTAARFNQPQGIVYARGGLVVVDQANQQLRYVSLAGAVSNLAGVTGVFGTNDGAALGGAQFANPKGIAVGNDGLTLYIADQGNNSIRMLSPANVVSTIATNYQYNSVTNPFRSPAAVAVDNNSNVWVTDSLDHVICMISNGVALGIAGTYRHAGTNDGAASVAQFNLPSGLLWDNAKGILVISDTGNDTIRSLYTTNTGYAVQTLAGIPGVRGFIDGTLATAEFFQPGGLGIDAVDAGYYVVDGGNNALRVLQPTQPPPAPEPVDAPIIGYLTFPIINDSESAQFNPITSAVAIFNNPVDLAIEQLDGSVDTYMSYGPTGSTITPPGTNTDFAAVFTAADVGLLPSQVPNLNIPTIPALTLEAISIAPGRPSSPAVSADIQFVTANPNIIGSDASDIVVSNTTIGAQLYYVLDNSTNSPTNDGSYGIGPVTSGQILALNITSNVNLKVRAFTPGFAPSATVTEALTLSNLVGNELTFGFATGVASTKYITAPGRTYFAPVTLSELPGTSIYTLQFDLTEFGAVNPVGTNAWAFQSLLMKPATNQGYLVPINAAILIPSGSPTNFTNLPTGYITTNDLMELSWITVPPQTNLYPTPSQDLTATSLVQGHEFLESGGQVVVGSFSFTVPLNTIGDTYTLQASLPSASTFGAGTTEPTGVLIRAPTNNSLGAGSINALKNVTVTNSISYLVGDVYPFSWFNAGEFGDNNLQDDDVVTTYESAVGSTVGPFNIPPPASDYFDAMNSAGTSSYNLYDANDNDINSLLTGGSTTLSVNDVYVTLRRSLDTNLMWVIRTWSNGVESYSAFTNFVQYGAPAPAPTNASTGTPRYISVAADQIQSGGNLEVAVPIRVLAADPVYPIRVTMLNVEIDPLDGSPPVTSTVSFSTGSNLGAPTLSSSDGPNDYAAAWLNSTVSGVSGTNIIGTLFVTLPPNATSNSAWRVHFDHFSASPNGIALFRPTVQDGLITVGDRSGSSWHDGISDAWRLLWFGTVSNALSAASADPDGDGANNFQEYVAGTNPNDATSVFQFLGGARGSSGFTLQWSSVANKHYSVQTSSSLFPGNWSTLATSILGNGQSMQWTDSNASGLTKFYRAVVQ
jgi:hypothetical protein